MGGQSYRIIHKNFPKWSWFPNGKPNPEVKTELPQAGTAGLQACLGEGGAGDGLGPQGHSSCGEGTC